MVDRRALGEPGNVVVDRSTPREAIERWARAGTRNDTQLWMQSNHPGKQVPRGLNRQSVAPSAVPFDKKLERFFATPRELTEAEIEQTIESFGSSGAMAQALQSGALDLVGLARPLAIDPALPNKLLKGDNVISAVSPRRTGIKAIDRMALLEVTWYERQLKLMGQGGDPRPDENIHVALVKIMCHSGIGLWKTRRLRA